MGIGEFDMKNQQVAQLMCGQSSAERSCNRADKISRSVRLTLFAHFPPHLPVCGRVSAFEADFLSAEKGEVNAEDAEIVPDLTQLSEDTFFPERILAERINNITREVEYQIQWWQSPHMEEANGPDISWSATAAEAHSLIERIDETDPNSILPLLICCACSTLLAQDS